MKLHVDSKDDIIEATADARGRITLGSEFADQSVTVVVVEDERDE